MRLNRRAFVERLDFQTSPGYIAGGTTRDRYGMPGHGPRLVITDRAIFDFENVEREMQLVSLHPGVSLDEVRSQVGWDLREAATIATTSPPTAGELDILRRAAASTTGPDI